MLVKIKMVKKKVFEKRFVIRCRGKLEKRKLENSTVGSLAKVDRQM